MTKHYYQFCPVAKAAEVFAERWTPLLIRELFLGTRRFNDLRRGLPLMSPTLLSNRLKNLEEAGVVYRDKGKTGGLEYRLTQAGEALWPVIESLGAWGKQWIQKEVSHEDLDAGVLMWDIHRRLNVDRLPQHRTILRFEFIDTPIEQRTFWLVIDKGRVDLCIKVPDQHEDLCIKAPLITLTRVWLGEQALESAIRDNEIELCGDPAMAQEFRYWLAFSEFAHLDKQYNTSDERVRYMAE